MRPALSAGRMRLSRTSVGSMPTSTRLVPYDQRHVDLMESFAGKADASLQAHRFELTASEPMDLDTGGDVRTRRIGHVGPTPRTITSLFSS